LRMEAAITDRFCFIELPHVDMVFATPRAAPAVRRLPHRS
jgi:hypothetical protein